MANEQELSAVLGANWRWQASVSSRKVGCANCHAEVGRACSLLRCPKGRSVCPARVLASARRLYEMKTARPAASATRRRVISAGPDVGNLREVLPRRVTVDDLPDALVEQWLGGDLSFEPTDELALADRDLEVARALAEAGMARVVVEDLDGNHRGVLWGPPYDHRGREAHNYAAGVPQAPEPPAAPPTLSPERIAEIEAAVRLAEEYERERAERATNDHDAAPRCSCPGPDERPTTSPLVCRRHGRQLWHTYAMNVLCGEMEPNAWLETDGELWRVTRHGVIFAVPGSDRAEVERLGLEAIRSQDAGTAKHDHSRIVDHDHDAVPDDLMARIAARARGERKTTAN